MSLESVGELVKRSRIILDIAKPGQAGLSFRFFEAMASRKKVITTNRSVVDYDFYNPANILVIDEANPVIPERFITDPYVDVPETIYQKYTLQGWVENGFRIRVMGPPVGADCSHRDADACSRFSGPLQMVDAAARRSAASCR